LKFVLDFINAAALAKVIVIGQELGFADRLRNAPLIYPTLLRSLVYTVLLACFKVIEAAVVSLYRGRTFGEGVAFLKDPGRDYYL